MLNSIFFNSIGNPLRGPISTGYLITYQKVILKILYLAMTMSLDLGLVSLLKTWNKQFNAGNKYQHDF